MIAQMKIEPGTGDSSETSSKSGPPKSGMGSYQELSPHEFSERKDLVVVVIKAPHVLSMFADYQQVIHLDDCKGVHPGLAQWKSHTLGLVCQDGDCSSRMAIRLSRLGHKAVHLAGGLNEWYQAFSG